MTVNTAGLVLVEDYGCPKTFTAYAKAYISGGVFVFASGANNVVSSGINSFASSDVEVSPDASGAQFNGVAVSAASSGATVSVLQEGVIIATANGTVTAGYPLLCDGNNSVQNAGSVAANLAHQRVIGRAMTSAASGGHALVYIRA